MINSMLGVSLLQFISCAKPMPPQVAVPEIAPVVQVNLDNLVDTPITYQSLFEAEGTLRCIVDSNFYKLSEFPDGLNFTVYDTKGEAVTDSFNPDIEEIFGDRIDHLYHFHFQSCDQQTPEGFMLVDGKLVSLKVYGYHP